MWGDGEKGKGERRSGRKKKRERMRVEEGEDRNGKAWEERGRGGNV